MATLAPAAAATPNGASSYSAVAKTSHWLVAVLLACQFATAALMPDVEVGTPVNTTLSLHFSFGIAIAVLMAARLAYRLRHPVAVAPGEAPRWERKLARATHLVFYAVLIAGPFLGWASASAHGQEVRLFGILPLPALAPLKAKWGLLAGDVHGLVMWTLLGLVALHAAAALFHHFVRHDNVLRRMLATTAPR